MSVFTLSAHAKITPQDLYMGYKYIRVCFKGSLHLACCGIYKQLHFLHVFVSCYYYYHQSSLTSVSELYWVSPNSLVLLVLIYCRGSR